MDPDISKEDIKKFVDNRHDEKVAGQFLDRLQLKTFKQLFSSLKLLKLPKPSLLSFRPKDIELDCIVAAPPVTAKNSDELPITEDEQVEKWMRVHVSTIATGGLLPKVICLLERVHDGLLSTLARLSGG